MSAANVLGEMLRASLLAKSYGSSGYSGYGAGLGLIAGLIYIFFSLALYIYFAICLMLIAKKTGTSNGWMAWIPVLNLYLMCKAAGKSGLWLILLLIPFVNIVALILLWAGIAQRLGRGAWWGILMIIPVANLILPGILAFSNPQKAAVSVAASPAASSAREGKFCPKCGAAVQASDKFCPDCGEKL